MKTSEAYEIVMETIAARAEKLENAVDNKTAREIESMTHGERFDRLNAMQIKVLRKAEKLWNEYIELDNRRRRHAK